MDDIKEKFIKELGLDRAFYSNHAMINIVSKIWDTYLLTKKDSGKIINAEIKR